MGFCVLCGRADHLDRSVPYAALREAFLADAHRRHGPAVRGALDAFAAALGYALLRGRDLAEAVRLGNRAGAFVASGRAGVDFTTLEPGDESPFVVVVPGAADVGRYRVSFRTDAGVVQHVDRRADQMRAAAALE